MTINKGQEIELEAEGARREAQLFSGHHHDMPHGGQSVEALAFQIAAQMTYDWPSDVSCPALFIQDFARDVALTVHLREMARF
jgi:hypothetical protein